MQTIQKKFNRTVAIGMLLFIAACLIAGLSACSDRTQPVPQSYAQPAPVVVQAAPVAQPVVVQQAPSHDSGAGSFLAGAMVGHMLSNNSQPSTTHVVHHAPAPVAPAPVQKTVVVKKTVIVNNNRTVVKPMTNRTVSSPSKVSLTKR